jgi:hypothetical protein
MGLKDIVLSAQTTGLVMNYPLYDGGVSEKAHRLIAEGRAAALNIATSFISTKKPTAASKSHLF